VATPVKILIYIIISYRYNFKCNQKGKVERELRAGDKYCNIMKHMLQFGVNRMVSSKADVEPHK
jgi:hypothetical protein